MEKSVTSPALKGLIISLILIVLSLAILYTGMMDNQVLGFLPIVVFIAGVIWACISFSNQKDHNVTFGNVFTHGFKVAAAITALMAVYTILTILFMPSMVEYSLEKAREAMEKQNVPESQIEQQMALSNKMMIPFALIGVILLYGLGGTIIALIGAAVAKKNPNPTPFN